MPNIVKNILKVILFVVLSCGIAFGIWCGGIAALMLAPSGGGAIAATLLFFGIWIWVFITRAIFSKKHKGAKFFLATLFTLVYAYIFGSIWLNLMFSLTQVTSNIMLYAGIGGWAYLLWRFFIRTKQGATETQDVESVSNQLQIPRALIPAVMYIRDARIQEFSDNETREMLRSSGWKESDIDEAFRSSAQQSN